MQEIQRRGLDAWMSKKCSERFCLGHFVIYELCERDILEGDRFCQNNF